MINVSVTEKKNRIYISCYGHSGIKGESLQCAGASTLFAALAVTVSDRIDYTCESGYGFIEFPATEINKAFLSVFLNGMRILNDTFPGEFNIR
ncbi:MAG: ribosomal-processing cysteine protease Prp [Clostridia bacterium]|nr:ribosomal-processing cysteine protease Prp [Clostridia bacterium]